jgi:hypothetical protein
MFSIALIFGSYVSGEFMLWNPWSRTCVGILVVGRNWTAALKVFLSV